MKKITIKASLDIEVRGEEVDRRKYVEISRRAFRGFLRRRGYCLDEAGEFFVDNFRITVFDGTETPFRPHLEDGQIFLGSPDSLDNVEALHTLLDSALAHLGDVQQARGEDTTASDAEIFDAASVLFTALTGEKPVIAGSE